jgi:AcrR family transcriptional regulator
MGLQERRQRDHERMHGDILRAAMHIVRKEGHESLSLRRLAATIEYSATTMYLYFKNKEALEMDLARLGYRQLNSDIQIRCTHMTDPRKRLKSILITYWNFAISETQLYLLIHEVEKRGNKLASPITELVVFINWIDQAIAEICPDRKNQDAFIQRKRYSSLAIVQGLVSLELTHKNIDAETKTLLLDDAMVCLMRSF